MNASRLVLAGLTSLPALLLAACSADSLPGGEGPAPAETDSAESALAADADHPCGDASIADVTTTNGNRLQLCAFGPGLEAFFESGPTGRESAVRTLAPARPACALEILLATTAADTPVPAALVAACADSDLAASATFTRRVVDGPVATYVAQPDTRTPRANYCGSSGASSFSSNECYHCNPYDDCDDWCITDLWGWHDRNFYGWMGDEGNVAIETTAACTGQVRVRAYSAEDAGDAWEIKVNKVLNAGTSSTYGLIYHSAAIFGQDYDFRLRATSESGGGVHRHSGYFLDE
jgi:hypothetical protein